VNTIVITNKVSIFFHWQTLIEDPVERSSINMEKGISMLSYYDLNLVKAYLPLPTLTNGKTMSQKYNCLKKYFLNTLILVTALYSTPSVAFNSSIASPKEVVKFLQSGGYIIYFRHGATIHTQKDNDFDDLQNCNYQRNLSHKGKEQSKATGEAIKKLNINIEHVYTSPFCRTIDTAKLIFNRYKVIKNLRASYATDSEKTKLLIDTLRKQLSKIPNKGTNTVIVGHTTNLNIITKVRSRPEGVAHIFKPLGDNGYKHIGKITPKQWISLAKNKGNDDNE